MRFKVEEARAGQVVADRYLLQAPVGRGGMGRVWRAEHLRLKSQVAIKFLDPAIADDPKMFDRFLREAQSAAAVRSAHVVQVFDCGLEGGTPYISMELLDGESLDARLIEQGTLTPAELNKIFGEVARAVGNAHAVGIVHRDLKPANIFISRERELEITKVLDFGLVKLMLPMRELDSAARTSIGTLLGTPEYMSPEQARGSRSLDQRTDLWSLAIIAFECLTGRLPFGGDGIGDVVVQICTERPRVPSEVAAVPTGFDEWFLKGTSKAPDERFASAYEMAETLSAILAVSRTREVPASARRANLTHEVPTLRSEPDARGSGPAAPPARPPLMSPLTLPVPSGSEDLGKGRGARAPRRWFAFAAPLWLLCGASLVALWPRTLDRAPSFVEAGSPSILTTPSTEAPGVASLAPPTDVNKERISAGGTEAMPEPAVNAFALSQPLPETPKLTGAAAKSRASDGPPSASSRRRPMGPTAPQSRPSAAERPGDPAHPALPAAPAPSTTRLIADPPESDSAEPFSERL